MVLILKNPICNLGIKSRLLCISLTLSDLCNKKKFNENFGIKVWVFQNSVVEFWYFGSWNKKFNQRLLKTEIMTGSQFIYFF